MSTLFRKLRWWIRRRDKEAELREELEFHVAEEAGELQAAGLGKPEARCAARRELGNLTLVKENTRAVWGWVLVEQLGQDLRYALRSMAASRLFTLAAFSSLALVSEPTRRFTVSWMPFCCVPCRCPIRNRWWC